MEAIEIKISTNPDKETGDCSMMSKIFLFEEFDSLRNSPGDVLWDEINKMRNSLGMPIRRKIIHYPDPSESQSLEMLYIMDLLNRHIVKYGLDSDKLMIVKFPSGRVGIGLDIPPFTVKQNQD